MPDRTTQTELERLRALIEELRKSDTLPPEAMKRVDDIKEPRDGPGRGKKKGKGKKQS